MLVDCQRCPPRPEPRDGRSFCSFQVSVASMARTAASADSHTYLPEGHEAEILDFIGALERAGGTAHERRPAIVAADGTAHEIPELMVAVLRRVAMALSAGAGVNVAPLSALLTTQEAADYLGISRPTLVRILERGDLPMEKPGRHRFVRLRDLVAFRERERSERRQALAEMQRQGQEDGLYEATDGIPPAMR